MDINLTAEIAAAQKSLQPAAKKLRKQLSKLQLEKLPIGQLSDLLYQLEQASKQLNAIIVENKELIEGAVSKIENHFINTLEAGDASGVQGKMARVQITPSKVPQLNDKEKFLRHVLKTKSWDLLLANIVKREAARERWDNEKQIPGVGVFNAKKVSCTKIGGR